MITFRLHCKTYIDNCLSTLIIYTYMGIPIFPAVDVLGLYNYN